MNKVILMGRLTKDPEVRYSQGAEPMAIGNFTIAVDRRFKREGEPTADFFDCVAFGKTGQFVEKYLKKATKIVLSGRLQNDSYTDKDGKNRTKTKVIADEIEFAESKKSSEENAGASPDVSDGFVPVPDSAIADLPFK